MSTYVYGSPSDRKTSDTLTCPSAPEARSAFHMDQLASAILAPRNGNISSGFSTGQSSESEFEQLNTLLAKSPERRRRPRTSFSNSLPKPNRNPFLKHNDDIMNRRDPRIPTGSVVGRYMSSFREGCELGRGSYASVYKCMNRVDGWLYAIKRTTDPFSSEANKARVLREAFAMASLPSHPNIVRYFGSWIEDSRLFLQLEWCNCGSLASILENGHRFTEKVLVEIVSQVSSGLAHIHGHGMLHLDVKPENILMHKESTGRVFYKIGDFGLARPWTCSSCSPQIRIRMGSSGGDGRYICPELLSPSRAGGNNMHPAADIFSLGMSVYELARGQRLPRGGGESNEYVRIRSGKIELPNFSRLFVGLVQAMVEPNPVERPTVDKLLKHQLLQDEMEQRRQRLQHQSLQHDCPGSSDSGSDALQGRDCQTDLLEVFSDPNDKKSLRLQKSRRLRARSASLLQNVDSESGLGTEEALGHGQKRSLTDGDAVSEGGRTRDGGRRAVRKHTRELFADVHMMDTGDEEDYFDVDEERDTTRKSRSRRLSRSRGRAESDDFSDSVEESLNRNRWNRTSDTHGPSSVGGATNGGVTPMSHASPTRGGRRRRRTRQRTSDSKDPIRRQLRRRSSRGSKQDRYDRKRSESYEFKQMLQAIRAQDMESLSEQLTRVTRSSSNHLDGGNGWNNNKNSNRHRNRDVRTVDGLRPYQRRRQNASRSHIPIS